MLQALDQALDLFRSRYFAFVAQVMPWVDPDLEELFLYGKALLTELPVGAEDPLPQLGKSVQLTHLRIAVTSDGSIPLEASDEPGDALPGGGKGGQVEPILDKLSAMIAAMNDKFAPTWVRPTRSGSTSSGRS